MSSKKPSQQFNGEIEVDKELLLSTKDREDFKKNGVFVIHENCDPILASNKSLPLDSYLVQYEYEGSTYFDIVKSSKRVQIFDSYYDRFGPGIKSIKWTDGRVNPKLWGQQPSEPKKSKRNS